MKKLKEDNEEEIEKKPADEPPETRHRPISPNIIFTDYHSVFDLIDDTSGERHIRSISPYTWVEVGPNKYVLSATPGFLTLEKRLRKGSDKEVFVVLETAKLPSFLKKTGSPYRTPRELAHSEDFTQALHAADTYASKNYPRIFISKKQSWRDQPATDGQLAFLNKVRPKDDQLTKGSLKKGKATDMITKLKHGARGRFAEFEADKRRVEREKLKVEQEAAFKRNEEVSVGPLLA